jgi:hypothetical protein
MSEACLRAAGVFLVAVALAPAARVGYLVYPINLLVWSVAFRRPRPGTVREESENSPLGRARAT